MKKKIAAIAVGLVAVISLAGCSGKLSNDYVSISQYKGLEVAKVETSEVTDELVESQIESNVQGTAVTEEVTDRASQEGDTVNVTATTDFENGDLKDYDIVIGSGALIGANGDCKSFEEQLSGHKKGDVFDLTAQFPDEYSNSPDLAGQVKTWNVTINSISKTTVPELTDEWVAANSENSKTVEEYKKEVKKTLEENNDSTTTSNLRSEVLTALADKTEVKKYPDGDVEDWVSQTTDYYKNYATQYNLEFADFLEQQMNMTEDDFNTKAKAAGEQAVKQKLAIQLVADKKKLEPSDKEYEEEYKKLAEDYGYADTQSLIDAAGEDVLKERILQEKVADYLIESCVQVEETEETTSDSTTDSTTDSSK